MQIPVAAAISTRAATQEESESARGNLEIETERAAAEIVEIEGQLGMELLLDVVPLGIVHAVQLHRMPHREADLPRAGQSGTDGEDAALLGRVVGQVAKDLRARADQ